jgi:Fic family protein
MPNALLHLPLPPDTLLETLPVLKAATKAHRYLAELKGVSASIPNEAILINTLALQEAKDSSEVENIITTHDELYKATLTEHPDNPAAKEVQDYAVALKQGFDQIRQHRIIRLADILTIQQIMEKNSAGLRKVPGTGLKNLQTGERVYTPPQDAREIEALMDNLVSYINDDSLCELDPLIKMAIIHHQFETIHPFYDGNGRTGRIINILYLVAQGLLDLPVLYLSRYVIQNKADYYRLLQETRETGDWQPWLLFMLEGVAQTSQQTITLIKQIKQLMQQYKHGIRDQLPKIYRQELLNNLFKHPYTKIEFMMNELGVSRITATKYLEQLVEHGYLHKEKIGRSNYYINQPLFALFSV